MRTNKKDRKKNARLFWTYLWNGGQKAAIVISRNPNNNRVQFITSNFNIGFSSPDVIAECNYDGIRGCFYELIENIHGIKVTEQVDYFDDKFKDWLRKKCHMAITYNDGYVMMIEYKK
jgi:hypothetical protein